MQDTEQAVNLDEGVQFLGRFPLTPGTNTGGWLTGLSLSIINTSKNQKKEKKRKNHVPAYLINQERVRALGPFKVRRLTLFEPNFITTSFSVR